MIQLAQRSIQMTEAVAPQKIMSNSALNWAQLGAWWQ